jgi:hypothetical protein
MLFWLLLLKHNETIPRFKANTTNALIACL